MKGKVWKWVAGAVLVLAVAAVSYYLVPNGNSEQPPSNPIVIARPDTPWIIRRADDSLGAATFGGSTIHPRFTGQGLNLLGKVDTDWNSAKELKIELENGELVVVQLVMGGVKWNVGTCESDCTWDLPAHWNSKIKSEGVRASGGGFGSEDPIDEGVVDKP